MKNYLKLSFIATVFIFTFSFLTVAEVKAQNILNEILKRMDEHQKALSSLKANVMMDKYNSQLDEHDIYEGTTMYLPAKGRDALVRIDWIKPEQSILSVVNKQYVLYRPRLKQAITGTVDSAQKNTKASGPMEFLKMSKEQLRANYTVVYLGQEQVSGGIPTWRLELTPKTAKGYKLAELSVDGNGMPIQAKITENNNDSTTVLLSGLQKNVTINASDFKVNLPKDTKIIKG